MKPFDSDPAATAKMMIERLAAAEQRGGPCRICGAGAWHRDGCSVRARILELRAEWPDLWEQYDIPIPINDIVSDFVEKHLKYEYVNNVLVHACVMESMQSVRSVEGMLLACVKALVKQGAADMDALMKLLREAPQPIVVGPPLTEQDRQHVEQMFAGQIQQGNIVTLPAGMVITQPIDKEGWSYKFTPFKPGTPPDDTPPDDPQLAPVPK